MANIKRNALAPSVDEAVLAAFRKLATPAISDNLDRILRNRC